MSASWFEVSPTSGYRDGTVEVVGKSRHTGRSARYSIITFKAVKGNESQCTIAEAGKPEYVDIADTANSEAEGKVVTIIGISNSAKLTFSLGDGDLGISLPSTYKANSQQTNNGAYISGDPGASAQYEFSIDIVVPTNDYAETYSREIIVTDEAGHKDQCLLTIEAAQAYITIADQDIELGYLGNPVSVSVGSNATWDIEGFEDGSEPWSNGGTLTATYTGYRNGQATFSSEPNDGIDHEMEVSFRAKDTIVKRKVTQEGLRQRFVTADGKVFCIAGGGRFGVLKPTIPSWRDTYKEVEYIESTGKQYINTGVYVNPDYTVEVTFVMTQRNATWDTLFGTRNSSLARFTARWANTADGKLGIHRSRAKTGSYENYDDANATKSKVTDTWHTIKLAKREYTFDGALRKTFSTTSSTTAYSYPIYLFALCNAGSPADYGYFRIKKARIWNDKDELIRDYIPCVDLDGVGGLYDVVNDTFTKSGSSTKFNIGALINQ